MCKLSLNIVPNVYNSLQSSFLLPAWPWPGRSLPKGNEWECWDPEQGPLPGLGEVGHSPRGTIGSAGTLDLGPMWLGSKPTCHPMHPYTLDAPNTSYTPYKPLYPCWPLSTYSPCQPPMYPDTPYTPNTLLMPPTPPTGPFSPDTRTGP